MGKRRNRKNPKKRRGHFCRICKKRKPNEKFSGKGHTTHLCKECQRLPKAEREEIEAFDEMLGFLDQSNISAKNIERLEHLVQTLSDPMHRNLAEFVLELARTKPGKKRRLRYLSQHRPDLFVKLWRLMPGDDAFLFPEEHGIPRPEVVQRTVDVDFDPPFDYDPAADSVRKDGWEGEFDDVPF